MSSFVIRAVRALRVCTAGEKTADDIWPMNEVKLLGGAGGCDHEWGSGEVFGSDAIFRGCLHCPAVQRVPPAPVADLVALEAWLNS